jgi:hypothetical protein
MMSAVANPVIYSWFNPQFRAAIHQVFHHYKRDGKQPLSNMKTEVSVRSVKINGERKFRVPNSSIQRRSTMRLSPQ